MTCPVTEIAYVVLKPGVDIEGSTPEAQAWQSTVSILKARPGFQRVNYGRLIESPDILMMFIDWDTLQHHLDFIADPSYGPFTKGLAPLIDSIHLHHFTPSPFPPSVLARAPFTEFATFYDADPGFLPNLEKFMSEVGEPEGLLGKAYGETVESNVVKHAEQTVEGKKGGKAVVLLIGWESKDAHMRFRETETFKKHIYLLREKTSGGEMFHVQARAA